MTVNKTIDFEDSEETFEMTQVCVVFRIRGAYFYLLNKHLQSHYLFGALLEALSNDLLGSPHITEAQRLRICPRYHSNGGADNLALALGSMLRTALIHCLTLESWP
jgi:hypothetical protein